MAQKVQLNKGPIRDNALKALVKSNLFRHKVERNKKAKAAITDRLRKKGETVLIPSRLLFTLPERQCEENQSISGCLKDSVKKINPSQAA